MPAVVGVSFCLWVRGAAHDEHGERRRPEVRPAPAGEARRVPPPPPPRRRRRPCAAAAIHNCRPSRPHPPRNGKQRQVALVSPPPQRTSIRRRIACAAVIIQRTPHAHRRLSSNLLAVSSGRAAAAAGRPVCGALALPGCRPPPTCCAAHARLPSTPPPSRKRWGHAPCGCSDVQLAARCRKVSPTARVEGSDLTLSAVALIPWLPTARRGHLEQSQQEREEEETIVMAASTFVRQPPPTARRAWVRAVSLSADERHMATSERAYAQDRGGCGARTFGSPRAAGLPFRRAGRKARRGAGRGRPSAPREQAEASACAGTPDARPLHAQDPSTLCGGGRGRHESPETGA